MFIAETCDTRFTFQLSGVMILRWVKFSIFQLTFAWALQLYGADALPVFQDRMQYGCVCLCVRLCV